VGVLFVCGEKDRGQATEQFRYTYESKSYFNGLTFALYSVMFSFSLLIPIFVAMSAGRAGGRGRPIGYFTDDLHHAPFRGVLIFLSKFMVCSASHLFVDGLFHRAEPAGRTLVCRWG